MKKKVVNHSLVILVLVVSWGLFQAWKESKNPFAFFSNPKNAIEKSNYVSDKSIKLDTKESYRLKHYLKE
ncbi:MAG: hypothetical protein Q8904_02385 [Bacteroidota bacterium]|nr:hypothetical protein [Bacteroidota bacterium]